MQPPLACSVRSCGEPLVRRDRQFVCSRGHSYDIARSGYVNLLQPQDRRSAQAGDSRQAVAARAALHQHGIGVAALDAVIERACDVPFGDGGTVVDLGSGTGDLLGGLAQRRRVTGVGIDLSPHAAAHAARRFPDLTWLVANADRRLPLLEGSVALVMSLHGRRNPQECARVLDHPGTLLVAFPAADDLVELRAAIEGRGLEQDRVERAVAEHEPLFAVADRTTIRERRLLEPAGLEALLRITYRGARHAAAARIETLIAMEVTFATEILRFTRR